MPPLTTAEPHLYVRPPSSQRLPVKAPPRAFVLQLKGGVARYKCRQQEEPDELHSHVCVRGAVEAPAQDGDEEDVEERREEGADDRDDADWQDDALR